MAPAVQSAVVIDTDMLTLLHALASCTELSLNTKVLAEQEGIARSDNALTKFKRVLKSHGYKFENKQVTKIDGDGSGDNTTATAPKKTPAKAKAKAKAALTPKKRKLEDADLKAEEEGEMEDGNEVESELGEEA